MQCTHKKRALLLFFTLCLAASMSISMGLMPQAAMPHSPLGQPNHGVNFVDMLAPGNRFYYGTYNHVSSMNEWEMVTGREGTDTPVLWRVMGQETGDDSLTLMSEYVLDSKPFHSTWELGDSYYNASDLRAWLNTTFLDNFSDPEQDNLHTTTVEIGMYDFITGIESTGIYTSGDKKYTYPDPLPWTVAGEKVYLPWGITVDHGAYWTAGNDPSEGQIASDMAANIATLKNSDVGIAWWLRSPDSFYSHRLHAVYKFGNLFDFDADLSLGIRPLIKLDPSAVLFASEIKTGANTDKGETEADGTNYFEGEGGTRNYKLTVMDTNLTAGTIMVESGDITIDSHRTVALGGALHVEATNATHGTNLTYKIVDGNNEIVGYGQGADNAHLTIDAQSFANTHLPFGNYTVYIWAQKNNGYHSHQASAPQYFTLTVISDEPETPEVTPPAVTTPPATTPAPTATPAPTETPAPTATPVPTEAPGPTEAPSTGRRSSRRARIPRTATPTITPETGTYTSPQAVTITCATPGSTIYYTTDGSWPTTYSTRYTGPITITSTTTIKAFAIAKGYLTSPTGEANLLMNTQDEPPRLRRNPFTDVKPSDWFFTAVLDGHHQGLFSGTSETSFSPHAPMTRAMFATVLARLEGVDLNAYTESAFSDVDIAAWYGAPVSWAAYNGIVTGIGGGLFAPDQSITREEMAVMLSNYITHSGETLPAPKGDKPFADDSNISPWAVDAVAKIRRYSLMGGVGHNTFNPQGAATRAEVAQVFLNYLHAIKPRAPR